MKQTAPTITLKNNTSAVIPITLFNSTATAGNILSNARTTYTWDITAETFIQTTAVTIQAMNVGAAGFTNYSIAGNFTNAAEVCAALNTLGIGIFFTYISAGSKFIATANDLIVYGALNLAGNLLSGYVYWQMNFNVPVVTPYLFHVIDTTAAAQIFIVNNQASGNTPMSLPLWIVGNTLAFEFGFSEAHDSVCSIYKNNVLVNQNSFLGTNFSNVLEVLSSLLDTYQVIVDVNA